MLNFVLVNISLLLLAFPIYYFHIIYIQEVKGKISEKVSECIILSQSCGLQTVSNIPVWLRYKLSAGIKPVISLKNHLQHRITDNFPRFSRQTLKGQNNKSDLHTALNYDKQITPSVDYHYFWECLEIDSFTKKIPKYRYIAREAVYITFWTSLIYRPMSPTSLISI